MKLPIRLGQILAGFQAGLECHASYHKGHTVLEVQDQWFLVRFGILVLHEVAKTEISTNLRVPPSGFKGPGRTVLQF